MPLAREPCRQQFALASRGCAACSSRFRIAQRSKASWLRKLVEQLVLWRCDRGKSSQVTLQYLSRGGKSQKDHFWRYTTTSRGLDFNKPLDIVVPLLILGSQM